MPVDDPQRQRLLLRPRYASDVLVQEQRQAGLASGAARRELAKSARDVLRERMQEHADEIWATYYEALSATDVDDRPDHRARFQAATALMAEANSRASNQAATEIGKGQETVSPVFGRRRSRVDIESRHVANR